MASTATSTIETPSRSDKARGRWKLLRAALLGQETDVRHSIHTFGGFKLIDRSIESTDRLILDQLLYDRDNFAASLLAAMALDPRRALWKVNNTVGLDNTEEMRRLLAPHVVEVTKINESPTLLVTPTHKHFRVYRYELPDLSAVLTRERVRTARKSLEELMSHQTEHQVDNTGNICVWDCEKVLTWYLVQQRITVGDVLLEMGSGMAGLAALACYGKCQEMFITDGHPDCVLNNQVNLCLMRAKLNATSAGKGVKAHSTLLRWSYDESILCQADTTFIADCTHFEQYHGELLWTMLRNTAVGGSIWMCQPLRGQSWTKFSTLMMSTVGELVSLTEHKLSTLDSMHQGFLCTPEYDENRHRPRIFEIIKRGELAALHREKIQFFLNENRTEAK